MSNKGCVKMLASQAIKLGGIMTLPKAVNILEKKGKEIIKNVSWHEKNTNPFLKRRLQKDIDLATAITLVLFELRKYK